MPRNWSDLAAPAYAGHIGLTSPARSGTTHLMVERAAAIARLGSAAGRFWSAIGGNLATLTARSFGVTTGVARGRFGIGISIDFLTDSWHRRKPRPTVSYCRRETLFALGQHRTARDIAQSR